MQKIDPTKMADWEIAAVGEHNMNSITRVAEQLGVKRMELMPHGHYTGKLDFVSILDRKKDAPNGKLIDVTAITPTPLGSGKSTTTIGLIQGLGVLNKSVTGAIRQPSMGPTFNIKGSAAGGGLAQCIPLNDFSLGLTGDIDAVTKAHNLGMVALTSRMQHEFNYGDATLEKKNLKRLNIDPRNVSTGWAIDFCAQSLRNIVSGLGSKMDGFMMESYFQIAVSSELMAILSVARNLEDMRAKIAKMILAYSKSGQPVTAADLEVDGAMAALLSKAIYPNLMQTLEGQPVLVHTGPFANIALGQSSILADRLGLKLTDYHITESGFGADIGYEKFWNLKTRFSGLIPDCTVLVVTIRDLKIHGGAPDVKPGQKLDPVYTESHPDVVEKGIDNMLAHIDIIKKSGVTPVVCLNHIYTDSDEEIKIVRQAAKEAGVRFAVSKHWLEGGEGALELAEAVMDACEEEQDFQFLYEEDEPLKKKVEKIAYEVYGAGNVSFSPVATKKIESIESNPETANFGCCMAKTQFSLTDNPSIKGRPKDWNLYIRDVLIYQGAGFVVPVAGDIKLMPGTASDPAFRRVDIDTETGAVKGLF